ncbi:MAG: SGNH/GDSL hydrolase family protein [Syntrophales bacterium]|nr:SGNH/GDSL hydrolase family protein [Syntrophales bacterium]
MRRPEKTIEKLKKGEKVVLGAIGDSLTYGWMVRKGYLDFLREMIGEMYPTAPLKIINAGLPGDTAEGGKARVRYDILTHHPDCVLVQFALNDAYQGYPIHVFTSNLKAIVEEIHDRGGSEIVLLTSVYLLDSQELNRANLYYQSIEEVARLYELPVARVHEYWKKRIDEGRDYYQLVQYDLVHPTEEGYRLMAEAVMELFK